MVQQAGLEAVELSLLREPEVEPFLRVVDSFDLGRFRFISIHAPSRYASIDSEIRIAAQLGDIVRPDWHLVLHPDASHDLSIWRSFESRLLVENMDKRKPGGRTLEELETVFEVLPEAGFCFDIAHVRQVDPTMLEAWRLLKRLGSRVREVHISEVNTASRHGRISDAAIRAFSHVEGLIPDDVAVILESPLESGSDIGPEIERARIALGCQEAMTA